MMGRVVMHEQALRRRRNPQAGTSSRGAPPEKAMRQAAEEEETDVQMRRPTSLRSFVGLLVHDEQRGHLWRLHRRRVAQQLHQGAEIQLKCEQAVHE